jgi:hypothetical protein
MTAYLVTLVNTTDWTAPACASGEVLASGSVRDHLEAVLQEWGSGRHGAEAAQGAQDAQFRVGRWRGEAMRLPIGRLRRVDVYPVQAGYTTDNPLDCAGMWRELAEAYDKEADRAYADQVLAGLAPDVSARHYQRMMAWLCAGNPVNRSDSLRTIVTGLAGLGASPGDPDYLPMLEWLWSGEYTDWSQPGLRLEDLEHLHALAARPDIAPYLVGRWRPWEWALAVAQSVGACERTRASVETELLAQVASLTP